MTPIASRHRVSELWSWLPAFRVAAELEHVHRAARTLNVTASSVSRAIRLLEEHLGRRLFDRVGRNLRLNQDGKTLLAAVRDAMRCVDDAIEDVTGTALSGELRVACQGDQPLLVVWRAAARTMARHASLTTRVQQLASARDVPGLLLRGELDVAVLTRPSSDPQLVADRVGEITYGIYCGRGHPLRGRRNVDMKMIARHPFVAPTTEDEVPADQWPHEMRRDVVLRLPALAAAISACESGAFLAVIPDDAATPGLERLPSEAIAPSSLYAVQRRGLADDVRTKATEFVADLRALAVAPKRRRGGKHVMAKTPAERRPKAAR